MNHEAPAELYASPKVLGRFDSSLGFFPAEEHLVREFFPPAPRPVLDLGCGNGRTTAPLAALGYDVTGLDICDALVAAAQARSPHLTFVVGDACDLRFPGSSFDVVLFSWNGIDHLYPSERRGVCLREAARVLRPGGLFLFSSHNALGVCHRFFRSLFLCRSALRFCREQLPLTRDLRAWYCRWWSGPELGSPLLFSAPPSPLCVERFKAGIVD
jgi:SAM-dependent methyltransferase